MTVATFAYCVTRGSIVTAVLIFASLSFQTPVAAQGGRARLNTDSADHLASHCVATVGGESATIVWTGDSIVWDTGIPIWGTGDSIVWDTGIPIWGTGDSIVWDTGIPIWGTDDSIVWDTGIPIVWQTGASIVWDTGDTIVCGPGGTIVSSTGDTTYWGTGGRSILSGTGVERAIK
jgi:hypothetical protein